uniref:Large ribosomal subunit protein uL30 n=1 Tax=Candidatus Aschnera chinzeii TaxID=1485666 RepID=A0AAT9G453_9ENTR|nr:MAG: 50S ribosomal protein L30 [Candidatus Aschnera chinzeii]
MHKYIKIKQIRSSIGILPKHKLTLLGLGLKYIGHTVIRLNTPEIIGMTKKISHIISVKEM